MRPARLSTAAGPPPLILVAHGSRDPRAAATAEDLAGLVRWRARRLGLDGLAVRVAYLGHAAPSPGQVLGALPGGPVVVLPLLLTDAYHTKTDIPAVLAAAAAHRGGQGPLEVRYGDPLGPHPLLFSVLERRLAQAGVPAGDPGTSVVLAAAGSSDPAARAAITALAAAWQHRRGWREVVPAYASAAEPAPGAAVAALRSIGRRDTLQCSIGRRDTLQCSIGRRDTLRQAAGAGRVVVASYLLAPGRFASQVAVQARAAGADAVSGVLGAAPELADIVLARYGTARARIGMAAARIA